MSIRIPSSGSWVDIDTNVTTQNFTLDQDNIGYRQSPQGQVMETLAQGVNHLLGRMPRVMFTQVQTNASAPRHQAATLAYYWRYNDVANNEFARTFRAIVSPPICSALSNGRLYRFDMLEMGDTTTVGNAVMTANAAFINCWHDVELMELYVNRGADASGSEKYDGITISGGLVVLDVVSQAEAVAAFDSNVHTCVNTAAVRRQGAITAAAPTDIVEKLHTARSTLLPTVFCWGGTNYYQNATATTSAEAIVVSNTATYTNPFDSSTTRAANSVGAMAPAYLSGVGPTTLRTGSRVKCLFRVCGVTTNARVDGNDSIANVMFIGPEHVAPNNCVITLNTALTVRGGAASYVFLNPLAEDNWINVDMNKIDMLVATDTNVNVHITSVQGWMLYDTNL